MKVITVWNMKGGVGKSTIAFNLAYNLSNKGKSVLVVDLDPQKNTASFLRRDLKDGKTIKEVLEGKRELKNSIFRSKYQNLDMVYGSRRLPYRFEDTFKLLQQVNSLKEDSKSSYDYVILDSAPAETELTYLALNCSDVLLTPIHLDQFCKDNLITVKEIYHEVISSTNSTLRWNVCINEYVQNNRTQREILDTLIDQYDYPFLNAAISKRSAVTSANASLKPVAQHRSRDKATIDFNELTEELESICKGEY